MRFYPIYNNVRPLYGIINTAAPETTGATPVDATGVTPAVSASNNPQVMAVAPWVWTIAGVVMASLAFLVIKSFTTGK